MTSWQGRAVLWLILGKGSSLSCISSQMWQPPHAAVNPTLSPLQKHLRLQEVVDSCAWCCA